MKITLLLLQGLDRGLVVAGSSEWMLGGMKMEGFNLKALLVGQVEWVLLELIGVYACQSLSVL
jgi:hypothetical protein